MSRNWLTRIALTAAVATLPLLGIAQEYGTDPAPAVEPAEQHVTGTVVSISSDWLELRSQAPSGMTPATTGSGDVFSFTLPAGVERPMDLKAGDTAEVWYRLHNGERVITRISRNEPPPASTASATEAGGQTAAATASSSSGEPAKEAATLPQTASRLPLIGLGGLLALGAALALRGLGRN